MEIDLELTEKSAKNTQRWWKLTATIDLYSHNLYYHGPGHAHGTSQMIPGPRARSSLIPLK